jgi:NAD(P)-dependent dehydrogenase (short-subunit alcohol dehydrogenase family)
MDVIARYVADQTENDDPMVLDLSRDPAHVVCVCRTDEDAEMVARALNKSRGAVEALRDLLDVATYDQDPTANTRLHGAAEQARQVLDRLGGR